MPSCLYVFIVNVLVLKVFLSLAVSLNGSYRDIAVSKLAAKQLSIIVLLCQKIKQ